MPRLRGLADLVFDAIDRTTRLVEDTQRSGVRKQVRRISHVEPLAAPAQAVGSAIELASSLVCGSVRLTSEAIRTVGHAGFDLAEPFTADLARRADDALSTPMRSDVVGSAAWIVDSSQGALNGVVGDFLRSRDNGLDLGMTLRREGRLVEPTRAALEAVFPNPTGKICVFVHGLACTEWCWSNYADRFWNNPQTHFGSKLESDLGYAPLFVRYNSGVHVSDNGERLATLLDAAFTAYPELAREIVLVGHSMGGLVARSAAHHAARDGYAWRKALRHIVCIGSPHLGAPLEKVGNVLSGALRLFDTAGTRVPAAVIDARSAGIKDLRFGYTTREEWLDRDPDAVLEDNRGDIPLLDDVGYAVIGSTFTPDPEHPMGQLLGDMMVRLPSAWGHHPEPARRIPFHVRHVLSGVDHLQLANHPDVYAQIHALLAGIVEEGTVAPVDPPVDPL